MRRAYVLVAMAAVLVSDVAFRLLEGADRRIRGILRSQGRWSAWCDQVYWEYRELFVPEPHHDHAPMYDNGHFVLNADEWLKDPKAWRRNHPRR